MANDARKWLPLALIATAIAVTALIVRDLPPTITIDLRGLLPFRVESEGDAAPRWVAVVGLPALAAIIWTLFSVGRRSAGLRIARMFFPDAPAVLADPATIDRFRATYDIMALWVVVLVLGVHAGMIAAALGHHALAPRIITVVLGISLAGVGNVMPRLRPNLLAGVRTRRILMDPMLWRATHRILGFAFVIAGMITAIVGLVAPAYGLATAVVTLLFACTISALAAGRSSGAQAVSRSP